MQIPSDLKFDERGLIPAIIQDWKSNEVLMMAYMNAESIRKTVETGLTWFWSRSRQKFWQKGETSGHIQRVKEILYDCDQDTLLIKVEQQGPACHTGSRCCFFRSFSANIEGDKR
jgi:phosphoribosyl-AMP cyclohydrolase